MPTVGRILSKEDCKRIHSNSLEILETIGVKVDHDIVFKKLCDVGAKPKDFQNKIVTLPKTLVERALNDVPKKVKLCDREGSFVEVYANGPNLFWAGNAMYLAFGKKRELINSKSFVELTKIMDSLENVHTTVGTSISDVLPKARDFVGFRLMAESTNKHIRPVIFTSTGVQVIIEMANILLNGKSLEENPIFSLGYSIVSPLHWTETCLDMYLKSSGYKIPIMVNGEPLAGGTAPVTLAGAITLSNAEILSGITILQILERGRPVIYNLGFAHVLDMKSTISLSASSECALMAGAGANLAEYYNLPSASWMSTESMMVDGQSIHEKTLNGLIHILNGINLIWGIGQLESQLTMSFEQAIIDNEIAGQLKRIRKGIEVSDKTIAIDVIKEVGLKGDFLTHEHTLSNFKNELYFPELIFRDKRDAWEKIGSKDLIERSKEKVKKILSQKKDSYISPSQREKIIKIEKKWMEKLG